MFHPRVLELIELAEDNDLRLTHGQAVDFVKFGLETFKWHASSVVSLDEYQEFDAHSPLLADIVGFRGPHLNHLTPRTLDIDRVESVMRARGFPTKTMIEGPPRRKCPILLRQTSFRALEEPVDFLNKDGTVFPGTHTARFGEVEERGAALTPAGRRLYDQTLNDCRRKGIKSCERESYAAAFTNFPDDWNTLRKQGLVWFRYFLADEAARDNLPPFPQDSVETFDDSLDQLIESGWVKEEPIVYEDFLHLSAAGIFQSNLKDNGGENGGDWSTASDDFEALQNAIGRPIKDEMANYAGLQKESLDRCKVVLRNLVSK
jgi:uncharacterized glyoxalase superfamily metalloenzyme YdcJ